MSVESVPVPQHLELDDVVAWGLSPTDLLCVVAGVAAGWWLYLAVPGTLAVQALASAPPALIGLSLGVVRLGDLSLREWLALTLAYAVRPRVLAIGGAE